MMLETNDESSALRRALWVAVAALERALLAPTSDHELVALAAERYAWQQLAELPAAADDELAAAVDAFAEAARRAAAARGEGLEARP